MRSSKNLRLVVAVVVGLSVGIFTGGTALANHPDATSKISIKKKSQDIIHGKVKSSDTSCKPAQNKPGNERCDESTPDPTPCIAGRDVFKFRDFKNRPDRLVGTTVTDADGKYEFNPEPRGNYFTRVENDAVGEYDHPRNCGAKQSETIKITSSSV